MSTFPPLLLVAHSGRQLAASAARAGLAVHVLDRFGDRDTRDLAVGVDVIRGRADAAGLGFDDEDLLRKAATGGAAARYPGLVVGAGLEDDVETLRRLAHGRELFGNSPEVVAQLKSPLALARLLADLRIAHPEVGVERPADPTGWLYKRAGSSGGADVLDATLAPRRESGWYYQRRVPGRSISALFAADGRAARLLGISEQYVRPTTTRPFVFAGAAGPLVLPALGASSVQRVVDRLVAETGLRGCNSVDFILDDHQVVHVLEVNPRPSATWDLYDADWPRGLLDVHLHACRGELPERVARGGSGTARAFGFAFAAREQAVDRSYRWPAWCTDIPDPGAATSDRILVGGQAPICTVHADGQDAPTAWRNACVRIASLESSLEVLH